MSNDIDIKKHTIVEISVIRVLVVILQLVFLKIYSHYSSFYELGFLYFLLTISYSVTAIFFVPLDYFQQSNLYNLKRGKLSLKSFFSINQVILKWSFACLFVGEVICFFFKSGICFELLLVVFYALSTYFVNLLRGFINNLEHRRQAIYCLGIEYVLKIVFYILFIHFFKSSSLIILSSLLAASLTTLIILIYLTLKLDEYRFENVKKFSVKEIFNASYPISISSLLNWVQLQSYTLLLVPFGLTEIVGIYATVANIGSGGMNAYSTIFSQLFIPNIYKTEGAFIKKYIIYGIISICFILLVSILFSKLIVELLTKESLVKYSLIIVYGILTEAGNFLIGALTIYLSVHNITRVSIRVSIIGIAVFFISFFIMHLIHCIGIFTIGLPMVLTQLTIFFGLFFVMHKNELKYHYD
jgi:O-antigen/teichoic acid export membrane protein